MLKPNIKTPRDFINPLLSKKSIKNADFDNFKKILDAYKTEIEAQHTAKQSEPNIVTNALKPFIESIGHYNYHILMKII